MPEIGHLNKLRVVKEVDFGVYLDGQELGEILLPRRYLPDKCKMDDSIEVFVYRDSEDRLIATTEKPLAMVGDFALLRVAAVSRFGAFLDWGLEKDLLVPFREQKQKMQSGKSYVVHVYLDDRNERIVASSRVDRFLNKIPAEYDNGEEVDLLIYNQSGMGFNAIINNSHWGILYKNEVFQPLKTGQKIKGFIKKLREDQKIDLSLQKPGYAAIDAVAEGILIKLKEAGGFISVTDKSDPEMIYQLLGISKKSYKKAIGALYKKSLIRMEESGISLH